MTQTRPENAAAVATKRPRTIRIDETCNTVRVITAPASPKKDTWYEKADYRRIKLQIQCSLQFLERGIPLDESNHSARGLEPLDPQVSHDRQDAVAQARSAVVRAQFQGKSASDIAHEYVQCTRRKTMQAYLKGIADERAAVVAAASNTIYNNSSIRKDLSVERPSSPRSTIFSPPTVTKNRATSLGLPPRSPTRRNIFAIPVV